MNKSTIVNLSLTTLKNLNLIAVITLYLNNFYITLNMENKSSSEKKKYRKRCIFLMINEN